VKSEIVLDEDEVIAFDMYFCSVASLQFHPGAGTKEHKALSISECKDVALDMVLARRTIEVRG